MRDEALKLALEALEWMVANDDTNEGDEPIDRLGGQSWNEYNAYWLDGLNNARAAITAIKQARSARQEHEPENEPHVSLASVQEPVAVVGEDKHGPFVDWLGDRSSFYERNPVGTKFYTTPPAQPAVPLTDEEIDAKFDAFASKFDHESNEWLDMGADAYFRAGFRAAHGITTVPEKGQE